MALRLVRYGSECSTVRKQVPKISVAKISMRVMSGVTKRKQEDEKQEHCICSAKFGLKLVRTMWACCGLVCFTKRIQVEVDFQVN